MWTHKLKMNSTKSFLGVSSGKFLGFIIASKGIHLNPDKIKAIQGYSLQRPSKSLEIYNICLPTSENSSQTYQVVVKLLQG